MAPSATSIYETANTFWTPHVKNFNSALSEYGGNQQYDSPKQLIGQALKQRIDAIDPENCEVGDEDAFFVADLGEVYRQHMRWKRNLSRVKPHYGMST